ncbi:hypothetical protein ACQKIE_05285 [Luteibacter sp. NPDC031894]|uniref:hypothetical protein n=1 Tax=Luteibacter sp. NPDC031894 TaxID=3390572 RepID=UPI003D01AA60
MNPNTPPPSDDDDLPDERELAALYARLPKEEPGSALDAAIVARAAQAVPARRHRRWPAALASAAVLVLAVGLAWQLRDMRPKTATAPAAVQERIPAPVPVPAPAPAPAAVDMPLVAPRVAKKVAPVRALPQVMTAAPMLAPRRVDLPPDDRVGEIRRLLDHGQREEALRRLHDLRLRYPRYDLPQDLRDLEP